MAFNCRFWAGLGFRARGERKGIQKTRGKNKKQETRAEKQFKKGGRLGVFWAFFEKLGRF